MDFPFFSPSSYWATEPGSPHIFQRCSVHMAIVDHEKPWSARHPTLRRGSTSHRWATHGIWFSISLRSAYWDIILITILLLYYHICIYIYFYIISYCIILYHIQFLTKFHRLKLGISSAKAPIWGSWDDSRHEKWCVPFFQLDIAGPMDECLRKLIVIDPDNSRYIQMSGWYFQTWPRRCRLKLNMLRTWANELRYLMIVPLVAHDYYYTWLIPDYTIYYILILGSSTLMVTCSDSAILRVTYSFVVAGTAWSSHLSSTTHLQAIYHWEYSTLNWVNLGARFSMSFRKVI
jgi:hypothetical protein